MTFMVSLSKMNKLTFILGISPYLLYQKSNKFESSAYTLLYTLTYFLSVSLSLIFIAFSYYMNESSFQSTFVTITFLQQAAAMTLFYCVMINLLRNSKKHANFLNDLVHLDKGFTEFCTNNMSGKSELTYRSLVLLPCFNFVVLVTNLYLNRGHLQLFEYVWNTLIFLESTTISLIAYYVRCLAAVLISKSTLIFQRVDLILLELKDSNVNQQHCRSKLTTCFEAFDDIVDLKTKFSDIFGIQLLLNAAYDFLIITVSAYGFAYFDLKSPMFLYYIVAYTLPLVVKCVLLVHTLDSLANQVWTPKD